jgi:hypothetical protein
MDIRTEALLRAVGMGLSVYFTMGWGHKSKPEWDTPLMLMVILAAVGMHYVGRP